MTLKTRLSKLEKTKRQIVTEAECICFPPDEPLHVELRVEMEAVAAPVWRVSRPGRRLAHAYAHVSCRRGASGRQA